MAASQSNLGECTEPLIRMVGELVCRVAARPRKLVAALGLPSQHRPLAGYRADGRARPRVLADGRRVALQAPLEPLPFRPRQEYLAKVYPIMKGAARIFSSIAHRGTKAQVARDLPVALARKHAPRVGRASARDRRWTCADPPRPVRSLRQGIGDSRHRPGIPGESRCGPHGGAAPLQIGKRASFRNGWRTGT